MKEEEKEPIKEENLSLWAENKKYFWGCLLFVFCRWVQRFHLPCEYMWAEYFASENKTKVLGDTFYGNEAWNIHNRVQCDAPSYDVTRGYRPVPNLKCHRTFMYGIRPVYLEVMNMRPLVMRYVGILSASEAQEYVDYGWDLRSNLSVHQFMYHPEKSTYNPQRDVVQFAAERTKESREPTHIAQKIQKRLQDVTGVDFQWLDRVLGVTYYDGPGAHHSPHWDFVPGSMAEKPGLLSQLSTWFRGTLIGGCFTRVCLTWRGRLVCAKNSFVRLYNILREFGEMPINLATRDDNRLMSFIVYVRKPSYGGRTIFPNLGITGDAEVGDVVSFMIARPDGTRDGLTYHASCPVVYGGKLIATVIPRERGQELRVRCPHKDREPFNYYDLSSFTTGPLKNLFSEEDDAVSRRILAKKEEKPALEEEETSQENN